MTDKKLYLIDATAFCYRAFYALSALSTSYGQPTNAIYGFINILNKILKDKKPDYLAVCFDVSRDTFRLKKFAEYKINRPPMPEGLSSQIPLIKEIVRAYGVRIFEKVGFEADDCLATLAKFAKDKFIPAVIVSSDKDMLQLVDGNTSVFSPYKDTGTIYDEDKVVERFGIKPGQIPDIIALMGDSVDNIPGVPGIGEKTAVALIKKYGSLKNLLENYSSIEPEKAKKAVGENIELIKLNMELALLEKDLDLDFNLSDLSAKSPDYAELSRIFKKLEFKKFLKELPVEDDSVEKNIDVVSLDDSQVEGVIGKVDKLALFGNQLEDMVFSANKKIFRINKFGNNIKAILKDRKINKISHDLKLRKLILAKSGLILDGLYFDTMLAGYLLNPSKSGYDLIDIAWDYLGSAPKSDGLNSAKAINLILELQPKLEKELDEKALKKLFFETEMPLVDVLSEMEMTGIKIDSKALLELSKDLEKRLIILTKDIYHISGTEFNINSPKQLREILFEKLKLPVVKKTKTGPSTDEEVLKKLALNHELPALLLEYRQLAKLKNTYVDTLPQLVDPETGRVHATFNQAGTETGRLSSNNPNLQNLPVKTEIGSLIRKAVIAFDKKSLLLACDYSQIELRILAHLSKDEVLISAFLKDKDIHKATAALIYNVAEVEVTDEMRVVAKRINFGIIYGLSSWGLSRDLGIPVGQAQSFIDAYFARYSMVKKFIDKQIEAAKKDGFVTTMLGRRRYLPEINNKNQAIRQLAERQAINTPIQGSASDLIKLAMIDLHKEKERRHLRASLILQIHDELVFDVPQTELDDFVSLVKDKMENVLKLDVPIRVSIKKGKNWLEMEDIL